MRYAALWISLETDHPAPSAPVRAFIRLSESHMLADPEDASDPGAAIQAAQLLLPSDVAGVWRELRRQSVSIADHRRFRLPTGWAWLYPLMRIPSWLVRRAFRRL